MLIEVNIRKSVMRRARNLLTTPPVGSGLNAYTVYTEEDLRNVMAGKLTPTNRKSSPTPCVFLVDSFIRPAEPALPMVVVEVMPIKRRPFEIGNVKGKRIRVMLHVFGRMRAERDDLAAFLADNFGRQLAIYDYSSSPSGVLLEYGLIEDEIDTELMVVREEYREEGSLDLWSAISLGLQTQN